MSPLPPKSFTEENPVLRFPTKRHMDDSKRVDYPRFCYTWATRRQSQRTTLAVLVWAVLSRPLLGVSKIGHHWAMAGGTSAKHAITRVDRFLGNGRIDRTVAPGNLISPDLGGIREALITPDWTSPKDGVHQILSLNGRTPGRAIPLSGVTVHQNALKDPMREGGTSRS